MNTELAPSAVIVLAAGAGTRMKLSLIHISLDEVKQRLGKAK